MEKSTVADIKTGKPVESKVRTSSGMFLMKAQDGVVSDIEARIAAWTFLPEDNAEEMQILHYERGQKYEPHFDVERHYNTIKLCGRRVATVIMYLSDVKKGGETVFPMAKANDRHLKGDDWSDCAKRGNAVKPRKGDAILFFSLHPNATIDPSSLHAGCVVIEGEKWSATKWIHERAYEIPINGGESCVDKNPNCLAWALQGECKKNPIYMEGSCRKSCKAC